MDGPGAHHWTTELTTKLIAAYRDNPCLWKITDKAYLNRNLKNEAYKTLVDVCKEHFPGADRDLVSQKIQSLRGSFRKELKKMIANKRSGSSADSVYKPTLWYYELLSFTASCETPTDSMENIDTNETPEIQGKELSEPDDSRQQELTAEEDPPVTETSDKPDTSKSKETKKSKRTKKHTLEESQLEFMQTCSKALTETQEVSEFDAVGILVSKKLRRMNPEQAMFAEDLINKVLSKGIKNQLSEGTDIIHRGQTNDHEWSRSSFASNEFVQSSWSNPSPVATVDHNPQQTTSEKSSFFPNGLYDKDSQYIGTSYTSL